MSTEDNTMLNTARGGFMGQAMGEQTMKVKNHQVDPITTIGNETVSTFGDLQWPNRELNSGRGYGSLYQR